mmetsp:Transcript_26104/g.79346  ORF Transcript_26104/g.79346 Transcript_26104/m.79346 type:complete len:215 (+) Transcript_26104:191-835(+)
MTLNGEKLLCEAIRDPHATCSSLVSGVVKAVDLDRIRRHCCTYIFLKLSVRWYRQHAVTIRIGPREEDGGRRVPLVHNLALNVLRARKRIRRPVLLPYQVHVVVGARYYVHDERTRDAGRRTDLDDLEAQLAAPGTVGTCGCIGPSPEGEEVGKLGIQCAGPAGVVLVLSLEVAIQSRAFKRRAIQLVRLDPPEVERWRGRLHVRIKDRLHPAE